METLNSSKTMIGCLVGQFFLSLLATACALLAVMVPWISYGPIHLSVDFVERAVTGEVITSSVCLAAACLGLHMLRYRSRQTRQYEILTLLNTLGCCLIVVRLTYTILIMVNVVQLVVAKRVAKSNLTFVYFGAFGIIPISVALVAVSVYIAVQARKISAVSSKRQQVSALY